MGQFRSFFSGFFFSCSRFFFPAFTLPLSLLSLNEAVVSIAIPSHLNWSSISPSLSRPTTLIFLSSIFFPNLEHHHPHLVLLILLAEKKSIFFSAFFDQSATSICAASLFLFDISFTILSSWFQWAAFSPLKSSKITITVQSITLLWLGVRSSSTALFLLNLGYICWCCSASSSARVHHCCCVPLSVHEADGLHQQTRTEAASSSPTLLLLLPRHFFWLLCCRCKSPASPLLPFQVEFS